MKKIFFQSLLIFCVGSCTVTPEKKDSDSTKGAIAKDTLSYPYTATYTSDLEKGDPGNAQKVLTVWKMYEHKQMDAMKPFYADTVTYDDARGNHFVGPAEGLLAIAKKEMEKLDSLRFDISSWESVHANDKNEDWVNVWCTERGYPKTGKADTSLMYEQWKIKNGRIYYFNQYYAKLPKMK
jgi:hypothetical protein